MRSFILGVGILAALGLGALSQPALAAGGTAGAVHVDTHVDVHANSKTGATFTAPQSGPYHFTVVSGAFCYLPLHAGETSPFGGWLTQLQLYTKDVRWGAPDQWGTHPIKPDATVGDWQHHATSAEAAAAGQGATVTVDLQKGTRVTLLVSDGSNYYGDNQGVVRVRITADIAPPAVATPVVAAPAVAAPPTPAKPNVSPDGTVKAPK